MKIAFRAWKVREDKKLWSLTTTGGGPWEWGINEAQCVKSIYDEGLMPQPHNAPHGACRCGIYGMHDPQGPESYADPDSFYGVIQVWGKCEVHETGVRAQFAKPVLLTFDGSRARYNAVNNTRAMCEEWGIDFAEFEGFDDLLERSKKYGELYDVEALFPPEPVPEYDPDEAWGKAGQAAYTFLTSGGAKQRGPVQNLNSVSKILKSVYVPPMRSIFQAQHFNHVHLTPKPKVKTPKTGDLLDMIFKAQDDFIRKTAKNPRILRVHPQTRNKMLSQLRKDHGVTVHNTHDVMLYGLTLVPDPRVPKGQFFVL